MVPAEICLSGIIVFVVAVWSYLMGYRRGYYGGCQDCQHGDRRR